MTLGDIIVTVVAEITCEPDHQVRHIIKQSFEAADRHAPFTDELSNREVEQTLEAYRKDPAPLLEHYATAKAKMERS
jgi:hypothetical protein